MKTTTVVRPEKAPTPLSLRQVEDHFVALSRTEGFQYYLGRFAEATDEELRSVFGLVVASIRQAGHGHVLGLESEGRARDVAPPAAALSRRALEERLNELAADLDKKEARIRELQTKLKKP